MFPRQAPFFLFARAAGSAEEEFVVENVLAAPSRETAIAHFESLRA